jgi:5-formaminoimidazole-4-carboxamide-1-(beta)-D-ribofuranosyl 5'-monophosphate synthetase
LAKPDEFIIIDSYKDIPNILDALRSKNAIIIPHGSFVEYMGTDAIAEMAIPTFGNRAVLEWESDREMEREWLEGAGLEMPKVVKPEDINGPVMV